ncbi:MAG: hypothetical protein ACODAQ_05200 [Phycisphaeraceae bacterium]
MHVDPLSTLLHRAGRLRLWSELIRAALWAATALIALGLVIVGIDAASGLPPLGLIVLDVLFIGGVAGGAAWLGRVAWRQRPRPAPMARLLEQRARVTESRLINAWQLASGHAAAVSMPLREEAIALGQEAARSVAASSVVDREGVQRAVQICLAAVLVLAGAWVLMPGVFGAVVPRLLQPTALHPPFTLVDFAVRIEPERVLFGDEATVVARLAGPTRPGRADVVFVDEARQPVQRLAMQRRSAEVWGEAAAGSDERGRYFTLRLDRAEQSRTFYIDTPEGRSTFYELTVHPVPRFERVHVRYDYPAYTGWPSRVEPLDGGLRALVGTQVTLTVASSLPLGGGRLMLRPEEAEDGDGAGPSRAFDLAPHSDEPRRADVQFALDRDGQFELSLLGVDGTPGARTLRGRVEAVPDEKPRIRITEPQPRTIAPEGWTVDVRLAMSDDIGLDRAELYRGVNGQGPDATDLPFESRDEQGRRAKARASFDLAQLGAAAGDHITYYAIVYDNHPGGGQRAETAMHTIEVVSMEQYKQFQRTRYRIDDLAEEWAAFEGRLNELEARRAALLDELEALEDELARGEPMSDAQRQRMSALMDQLDAYREEGLNLFLEMRDRAERATLYDFENAYKDRLRRIGAELQTQAHHAAGMRQALRRMMEQTATGASASAALRQNFVDAARAFEEHQRPFTSDDREQRALTSADIEALRRADALMAEGERIRRVAIEQEELADRLAAYRDQQRLSGADQLRAAELAERQAQLREELEEAVTALREAAEAAQDTLPRMSSSAMAIAEKAESLRIAEDQATASQFAATGNGRDAYEAARSAADKLDSLLSDCEAMGGQASEDLDGRLQLPRPQLRQSLSQMAAARAAAGLNTGGQGASGYGMSGSMARMSIVGPGPQGRGGASESDRMGGADEGTGHGRGRGADPRRAGTERLQPEQTERHRGAWAMPGVPQTYRAAAEAYFKRLADESE